MDGVYCCETCPDEELNESNPSSVIDGDKDDVNVVKDISSDNVSLDSNNQLTTAIEKTEQLVSSRKESLVGIRKMMFENFANKRDVSELTDDDKVVIKTKKGSLVDDKFSSDNGENKSFIKSDKIISSSSVDGNVDFIVNKLSDSNLDAGDNDSVKNIVVNNEPVTDKLSDDVISDKNNKYSDLPFIDSDCKNSRVYSKSVNIEINNISEEDNEAFNKNLQGVACELNETNLEESRKSVEEPTRMLSKEVAELSEKLVDEKEIKLDEQDTYLEMKSLSTNDVSVEENEPIYEEIKENISSDNTATEIVKQEDIDEKTDFVSTSNKEFKVVEAGTKSYESSEEKSNDGKDIESSVIESTEEKLEGSVNLKTEAEVAIIVSEESRKKVESVNEIKEDERKRKESIDYPSELNPFGDEDEDVGDEKDQTASTNPFESDMEDEEEERKSNKESTSVPVPAARASKSYSANLNPFWSGSEEEEDDNEKTSLLSPPVPLPRKMKTPQMSPTPIPRSSRHRTTSSIGSASSFGLAESPSPIKKKSPAPAPPSQNSTLKKRKARPPPPPPPLALTGRSPTPSVSSDMSAPVTPIMREKIEKDSSNRQKQITDGGTFPRNKSTFGQWKRKKGQAPPPPLPQRRIVKPMPLKQVRQELADIEVKQQELERQGVTLEQTIRDKFDQESSMTPYVEELVLQLFELVNEKNELFRRQAELMYLRRQHNLEEEHAELEYQIRCLMLCPEHNKTDSDKEREEELIKRLVDVVERRNAIVQCLEMDRLREAEEDRSVNTQLGNFSAAIGSEIDLTICEKKEKKHKKEKKKEKDTSASLDRDVDTSEKMHKYKKLKKKWFTLQHQKKP